MKSYSQVYALLLMLVFCASCRGQVKTDLPKDNIKSETKSIITSAGPNHVTRNIIQDRKGNIWIASWDGIFRYDGKSFSNITSKVSSSRFFSVLEDSKGNLWFGSIGSGVYCYNGKSLPTGQAGFKNFTTRDGLAGNDITCIYEDKTGNIWFGTDEGASCYDGRSFRNYRINGGVNSIIEDKTGKFWFATTGNTCVYNDRLPDGQGKTFTVFTHHGKPFTNVHSIIEDKKGNIWFGGKDGLWRYSGSTFTNLTQNSVGYIYEDKKGNIWTSSESATGKDLPLSRFDEKSLSGSVSANGQMVLSRYDEKSLSYKTPTVTEIKPEEGMICGILEAFDGSIWFGTSNGVYRYNGSTITDFKGK
jgi:ligand-binding sensor domain-containing protein